MVTAPVRITNPKYVGGCQNYGALLGPLNTSCRITLDHNFDNHPCIQVAEMNWTKYWRSCSTGSWFRKSGGCYKLSAHGGFLKLAMLLCVHMHMSHMSHMYVCMYVGRSVLVCAIIYIYILYRHVFVRTCCMYIRVHMCLHLLVYVCIALSRRGCRLRFELGTGST